MPEYAGGEYLSGCDGVLFSVAFRMEVLRKEETHVPHRFYRRLWASLRSSVLPTLKLQLKPSSKASKRVKNHPSVATVLWGALLKQTRLPP